MSEEYKGKVHNLPSGTIFEGDWMTAPLAGNYDMAEVDGPFGMRKAAWDMMNIEGLAAWYRPHMTRLTSLMAHSSSVYLWNTAEGWARIDPEMRALGWELSTLIIWRKTGANPALISAKTCGKWPDITEVCGHYMRGDAFHKGDGSSNVWDFGAATEMQSERLYSGNIVRNIVPGHGNIQEALHPCQKPLIFAERMVQASTRPGARILVPFGGTARIAVYCEHLARTEPDQARWVDTCELNQDKGRDYIGPVLAQMRGEAKPNPGQIPLFGVRK